MKNRRNHYRVLHVQPDAPLHVIKANYRTLMQTLRLHPDLGGNHATAVLINEAFATLKNPVRRAAYDRELFAHCDIATVSRGPLRLRARPPAGTPNPASGNQRNFYRVLQVQPDTPAALIEASYRALSAQDTNTGPLLAEALATLRDPVRREAYDRSLALGRPTGAAAGPSRPVPRDQPTTQPDLPRGGAYEPLVAPSCLFCRTPHRATQSVLEETGCVQCRSPLFPPHQDLVDRIRRSLDRSPRNEEMAFYTSWPGARLSGRLHDLSPTGLRFLTAEVCRVGDIIKIEATRLQAVGAIVHEHRDALGTLAGVRFYTVGFRVARGSFVSARA